MSLVGTSIGHIRFESLLGMGGMGEVYRAFDEKLQRVVAVKTIRAEHRLSGTARARFLREARILSRLANPLICQVYDLIESEEADLLVLEFVDGETLDQLRFGRRLAEREVLEVGARIAEALTVAHREHIIHRDLKPANIMYDPATQKARLLDFGIARDAELPAEERLTRAGFFVGTLQYVAPEALSGELVGEQADVYSLAVIAYQLLTELTPFPGKNPRELFQQLLTQDPISLNEAVKGLKFSSRLEEVVMKGLARDLGKRWKTVTDFTNAFQEAVTAQPEKKGGFFSSLFKK